MSQSIETIDQGAASPAARTWGQWLLWIAAEDHCEWANPYVARLRTPLGVLLMGAVASLLCGLFVAPQGFAIFGAIVGIVVLGLAWPWVAMRGIRGSLEFAADRGREGKPTAARFVVTNSWPWPVWGLSVNEPLLAADGTPETTVALARIDGWSRATFNCTFTPSQRGVYPQEEVHIGSGFPFGLYGSTKPVEIAQKLIVWPQTFWLPPLPDESRRVDWRGEPSEACVGSQGTRMGPRDHRQGDTLRDVHWSKSARYDRLIVSEREAATVEDHTVVVDVDRTRHSGDGADSTFEWSLRIAASICEALVSRRGTVTLWLGSEEIAARSPGEELRRLLDAVAVFEAPVDVASRGRRRRGASASQVSIGAETTPARSGRFICLRTAGSTARKPADAWIAVDSSEDVAGQVLRGWRDGTRRPQRAS